MAEACALKLTTEPGWIALDDGWRVRRDIWTDADPIEYRADRWVVMPPGLPDTAICFESYDSAERATAKAGLTRQAAA